jgi:TPR repeat protein
MDWAYTQVLLSNVLADHVSGGKASNAEEAMICRRAALDAFRRIAISGDSSAFAVLGYLYGTGDCVENDAARAVELYTRAGDAGHGDALFNLGVLL